MITQPCIDHEKRAVRRTDAADKPNSPDPGPEVPPPRRPTPGTPAPGDPPDDPAPLRDPPPSKPVPDSPGPAQPDATAETTAETTGPGIDPLGEKLLADAAEASNETRPQTAEEADDSCDLGDFLQRQFQFDSKDIYAESLRFMERFVLTQVLRRTGGNKSQAARLLGITRGSLRYKIRSLGLTIRTTVNCSDRKVVR